MTWHMTRCTTRHDTWYMIHDTTHDTWHMTHDTARHDTWRQDTWHMTRYTTWHDITHDMIWHMTRHDTTCHVTTQHKTSVNINNLDWSTFFISLLDTLISVLLSHSLPVSVSLPVPLPVSLSVLVPVSLFLLFFLSVSSSLFFNLSTSFHLLAFTFLACLLQRHTATHTLHYTSSSYLSSSVLYYYCAAWNADAVLRWEFCLSVCLSVCQMRELWQKGIKICQDFYTMRKII